MVAALQQGAGVGELDFTKRSSAEHLVPEPEHNTTGAVIKALDALLLVDVALDGAGLGKGAAAEEGCGDGSQFEFHLDVPLRWSAMPFNAAAREVEYRTPP